MKTKTCVKCQKEFRVSIKGDDGKWRNYNKRTFCLVCSPFKSGRGIIKRPLPEEKRCSSCRQVLPISQFYHCKKGKLANKSSPYCKKCYALRTNEELNRKKQWMVDYKGGSCKVCGYDRCISALDFHHIDPSQKEFAVSQKRKLSIEKLRSELDKCLLLCCRCHREVHAGLVTLDGFAPSLPR